MNDKRVIEIIKNINKFENSPFVVVGPDGTKTKKLRIYCHGARVGRIATTPNAHCEYFDEAYRKHDKFLTEAEKNLVKDWVEEKNGLTKDNTIDTKDYLTICNKLSSAKFNRNIDKTDEKIMPKERNIQLDILNLNRKHKELLWQIVDIETGITSNMVGNSIKISSVKKPDFVLYDCEKGQVGVIELKFDNKNVGNLYEHYTLFNAILNNPASLNAEVMKRAEFMTRFELFPRNVFDEIKYSLENNFNNKIWFGFLFVGGNKNKSIDIVKKSLNRDDVGNDNYRFIYLNTTDELLDKGLCYSQMQSYDEFISKCK